MRKINIEKGNYNEYIAGNYYEHKGDINQYHSGSGDNVAGNKNVTNINSDRENNRNNSVRENNNSPTTEDREKAIFISYSWSAESKAIVDLIDENFTDRGIEIIRDTKNVKYKDSIKEFMQRIGKGKCIIVIISQKYLESENCMFELIEIAEHKDFKERIFPIVLKDAKIYDSITRLRYIKYWQDKSNELNQAIKEIEDQSYLQGFREDLDLYTKIRHTIAGLTDTLRDMNALTPDMHLEAEFQTLFQAIENKLQE